MFDLTGKVALVTGGNGGIGLGMARGLAACGARVVVVGRNAEKNAAAVAALNTDGGEGAFALQADLAEPGSAARVVDEVVARAGGLAILVNNAGTNIRRLPQDVSDEDWYAVMDANLTSAMRMCRKGRSSMPSTENPTMTTKADARAPEASSIQP